MPQDALKAFGAGVRALRLQKGLTQEKLAELSELDQTYISGIERGRRNLGYRNLVRVARALGVSGSDLVAEAERLTLSSRRAQNRRPRRTLKDR